MTAPATSSYPTLGATIEMLPAIAQQHARTTGTYRFIDQVTKATVASAGLTAADAKVDLGSLGMLALPYTKMGAIDTLDSFGLDELMIFAFYWQNRTRYRRTGDIGGNVGVHSILMARCGWEVETYEPDPKHLALLRRNLALNGVTSVRVHEAAVSDKTGTLEFVRVLGNTTSSHLAGAKEKPYGELERFPVHVADIRKIVPTLDFLKVDAEGEEGRILLGIERKDWQHLDVMLEVGNPRNAEAIFGFTQANGLNAFAQKLGWGKVTSLADMPVSYMEGSLFVSGKEAMNWK
jgi:FkbM family methyltransferase